MIKSLQKIGNSKGLVLDRTMLEHLGITNNAVEVRLEADRLIITAAPEGATPPRPRRQKFEDAMEATFAQYPETMKRLSEPSDS